MNQPKCPKCSSRLEIQTADNKRLYVCPNGHKYEVYGKQPSQSSTPKTKNSAGKTVQDPNIPRTLQARPRIEGYKTIFFETAAIPRQLLKSVKRHNNLENSLRALSQWRIDFRPREKPYAITDTQGQILSIVWKILTRGRITLASPMLEDTFSRYFSKKSNDGNGSEITIDILEQALSLLPNVNYKGIWLDKNPETGESTEADFWENLLPEMMGRHYGQYVIPQIKFTSLIPGENNNEFRSADFAIFHPNLKEKLIVEIDGPQHEIDPQKSIDHKRDTLLAQNGYTVIRIPTREVSEGKGQKLAELESLMARLKKTQETNFTGADERHKRILALKFAHQLQVSLIYAFYYGLVNFSNENSLTIITDLHKASIMDEGEIEFILAESIKDLHELMTKVANIYEPGLHIPELQIKLAKDTNRTIHTDEIAISFTGKLRSTNTLFIQAAYAPFSLTHEQFTVKPTAHELNLPEAHDLTYFLKYIFGYDEFQEGQLEGISRVLKGQDTLLLLPTGAGKSLVYQFASFILPGFTIIVDPIIALMEDQVYNLAQMGIDRCIAINSLMETDIRANAVKLFTAKNYIFSFIAPERLQINEFRTAIKTVASSIPISLMVVDEAHCVSEWGHTFRTSYLNLTNVRDNYCCGQGSRPPLLGLTGTASYKVLNDIKRELRMGENDIIRPSTMDRPELNFRKVTCEFTKKSSALIQILQTGLPKFFKDAINEKDGLFKLQDGDTICGLIFCINVDGDYGANNVLKQIKSKFPNLQADIYTGKPPKNRGWTNNSYNKHKAETSLKFKANELSLLVCTNAFGMGIDKPNIRYTIHYGIPASIEAFYQEAGRSGRGKDPKNNKQRLPACCCIIASNDSIQRTEFLLSNDRSIEDVAGFINSQDYGTGDDITRALFLHISSFPIIKKAKAHIDAVIRDIGDISQERHNVMLNIPQEIVEESIKSRTTDADYTRLATEKALHRLVILGIVRDYTIDHANKIFQINISGISPTEILLNYIKYVTGYSKKDADNEYKKAIELLSLPYTQFVFKMVDFLLSFIYENIEKGRRQALKAMVETCDRKIDDTIFRKRILDYFKAKYQVYIDEMLEGKRSPIEILTELIEQQIAQKGKEIDPFEAEDLRGEVSRILGDYPMFPEFLMLRAISEALSRDRNDATVTDNFYSSIDAARNKYNMKPEEVWSLVARAISYIERGNRELAENLICSTIEIYKERLLSRKLIEDIASELCYVPAWQLLSDLEKKCAQLILS